MAGTLTIGTISDGTNSTSVTDAIKGSAKAWVNFNGVTTATIRASYNVSSVTRNGTGDYTVNFTTAMPDANYCVLTTGDDVDCATGIVGRSGGSPTNPTTTSVRVWQFLSDVNIFVDAQFFNVAIFR